jgi:hypothetical protein
MKLVPRTSWKTESGFKEFILLCRRHGVVCKEVDSLALWMTVAPTNETWLPLLCTACGVETPSTLRKLKCGYKPACVCNGRLSWKHPSMYIKFTETVHNSNNRLLNINSFAEWCLQVNDAMSKVEMECIDCGLRGAISITKFYNLGHRVSCSCNNRVLWQSAEGRRRLLALIDASRFVLREPLARHLVQTTRLCLRCSVCGHTTRPVINELLYNNVGCLCKNATHQEVFEVISDAASATSFRVEREVQLAVRGIGGRPLRADGALVRADGSAQMYVEIDGPHHFDSSFKYSPRGKTAGEQHLLEYDVLKERCAVQQGAAVLRLDWWSVRSNDTGWASWLRAHVFSPPSAGVYRYSHQHAYSKGEYAALRKDDPLLCV